MKSKQPEWVICGKTIRELIEDLSTFGDQTLEARISVDGGISSKPISIVKKAGKVCLIVNSEMSNELGQGDGREREA